MPGGGANSMLPGVRIVNHMTVEMVSFTRAFVHTVNHALFGEQLTRNRLNVSREFNFWHNAKDFKGDKLRKY
jgi:hypothetical protein